MNFFLHWFIFYVGIMFAMCIDNICWIPDSRDADLKKFYTFVFLKRIWAIPNTKEAWSYCWNKRILEVLKHPRDIIPGVITSFILGVLL